MACPFYKKLPEDSKRPFKYTVTVDGEVYEKDFHSYEEWCGYVFGQKDCPNDLDKCEYYDPNDIQVIILDCMTGEKCPIRAIYNLAQELLVQASKKNEKWIEELWARMMTNMQKKYPDKFKEIASDLLMKKL